MVKKQVFTITDMDCVSCAITIDGALEDANGVRLAKTNYARGRIEVIFETGKITKETILDIIKQNGYTASVTEN